MGAPPFLLIIDIIDVSLCRGRETGEEAGHDLNTEWDCSVRLFR
ncbi:MAG: hypothetical protein ACI8UO_003925 [Verrucomicrobiales bacterium]|jgi:hypothetical protein